MNPTPNPLDSRETDDQMAPNQKSNGTTEKDDDEDDNRSHPVTPSTGNSVSPSLENANLSSHDGNGNVIAPDDESDGIFLMVRCKNFLRNSELESNDGNEVVEPINTIKESIQEKDGGDERKMEKLSSDEEFEISTWSWTTENHSDPVKPNESGIPEVMTKHIDISLPIAPQSEPLKSQEPSNPRELKWSSRADAASGDAYYCDGFSGQTADCHNGGLCESEPIHMTLEEVKSSLQRLYGNKERAATSTTATKNEGAKKNGYGGNGFRLRHRKNVTCNPVGSNEQKQRMRRQRKSFPSSLKQTLCGWFKRNGGPSTEVTTRSTNTRTHSKSSEELSSRVTDGGESSSSDDGGGEEMATNLLSTPSQSIPSLSPFANRALPPLPLGSRRKRGSSRGEGDVDNNNGENDGGPDSESDDCEHHLEEPTDFTSSIYKVKDYGWYWGPISGETAERLLANEPDGSFVVRDSSDEHYIFSLTFKLNGLVRHVRIEHDQGNFSFGTFTNFKSHTIVGFIENAVEHSRSGRYLFFLHRRPVLGPMRVQLLHPVSRFKQVQSLQHMCRFVILKAVRRDLITHLPLPRRLKDYLNTPQYYTEEIDATDVENNELTTISTNATSTRNRIVPAATPEQHLVHGDLSDVVR